MAWRDELLIELAARAPGGYEHPGPIATEPTALAAIALAAAGKIDTAVRCGDWLCDLQNREGSVGVMAGQPAPPWPTSLAMLAWHSIGCVSDSAKYGPEIAAASQWAIAESGTTVARKAYTGHNTLISGWPWAAGTHSWLEPTAFFVLALRAVGLGEHSRTREGIRLLVDRLLPGGGCNYGNTIVLGQELLPHLQPTGIALWALGGESVPDERIELSLKFLIARLGETTATASLCFGLLGLTAHNRRPRRADQWLEAAFRREMKRGPMCYKLALLALAATATPQAPSNTLFQAAR